MARKTISRHICMSRDVQIALQKKADRECRPVSRTMEMLLRPVLEELGELPKQEQESEQDKESALV